MTIENKTPKIQQLEGWLAAVSEGDSAAFDALYASTSPHLFALLLRMLRQHSVAEDALQDCYVRIWQKAGSYKMGSGTPMPWLYSIARYRALDLLRQQRPVVDIETVGESALLTAIADGREPLDASESAAEMNSLERTIYCLKTLTGEQRDSLILAYYEGYSHSEMADQLSAPVGTVKSWVRRGLSALRSCMGVGNE